MAEDTAYISEYRKYRDQLKGMVKEAKGESRNAHGIRATLNNLWNKLTPKQQKQIAEQYMPEY